VQVKENPKSQESQKNPKSRERVESQRDATKNNDVIFTS